MLCVDGLVLYCTLKETILLTFSGLPFSRIMPKITAVAGNDLVIKCPVAGYPIESITWERGKLSN